MKFSHLQQTAQKDLEGTMLSEMSDKGRQIEYVIIYMWELKNKTNIYKYIHTHNKMAQIVKNLSAMQETGLQSLDWKDPLEKEMATHSGILGWRIPWTVEPGGLQSMGSQRVRHD